MIGRRAYSVVVIGIRVGLTTYGVDFNPQTLEKLKQMEPIT
ncbi:TPA: hypothetical protein ACPOOB_000498 [Haemophilus influenzae]|nr:hypothetical protein [Haemophilus influenzae]AGV11663.1 hypothetical protein HifGL_000841 [Haemophilus influenzae KR494]AGV11669.1 hypothetical protein HifGL_000848 [Haemophilus influenzae KR494]MDF3119218.1 hypothetical protein [Haemophilus influenzae]PRI55533.1 hypothetical protein BVZ81_00146 [Haemophilus influenzae]PRJ87904.1 hypothetical protein BV164_00221 [Haemophilus influenzae]